MKRSHGYRLMGLFHGIVSLLLVAAALAFNFTGELTPRNACFVFAACALVCAVIYDIMADRTHRQEMSDKIDWEIQRRQEWIRKQGK
jgi:hypothetical protein